MSKLTLFATAALACIALAACDGPGKVRLDDEPRTPFKAVTTLECPDHQGGLTRVRTTPDGLSCVYAGPKGAEVTLRLVRAGEGGTQAILTALEAELNALMPGVAQKLAEGRARAEAEARADSQADAAEAKADAERERAELEAERYEALADQSRAKASGEAAELRAAEARLKQIEDRLKARERAAASDGEEVNVRLPGMRVKTEGDKADVRLPGISVKADGEGRADVQVGPIKIKADDKGNSSNVNIDADDTEMNIRSEDEAAEIRSRRKGAGTRASFILADETPGPGGWRMVGYEARGPEGGPLVVAVVKQKDRHDREDDDVFDDAKALVRRNAGG